MAKSDRALKCISDCLFIHKDDYYITHCVKCYDSCQSQEKGQFSRKTIERKFKNCHKHFEIEIATLQPQLLIALDDHVKDLLGHHYQVDHFIQTPCLCSVKIKEEIYPLLVINQIKSKEDKERLITFLSQIEQEIKSIFANPRQFVSIPKQRVVRIE